MRRAPDGRRELAKPVEPRFRRPPVVAVRPVRGVAPDRAQLGPLPPAVGVDLIGPASAGESLSQIGEDGFRDLDPEGLGSSGHHLLLLLVPRRGRSRRLPCFTPRDRGAGPSRGTPGTVSGSCAGRPSRGGRRVRPHRPGFSQRGAERGRGLASLARRPTRAPAKTQGRRERVALGGCGPARPAGLNTLPGTMRRVPFRGRAREKTRLPQAAPQR